MKVVALDYGSARTGVAVTAEEHRKAGGLADQAADASPPRNSDFGEAETELYLRQAE